MGRSLAGVRAWRRAKDVDDAGFQRSSFGHNWPDVLPNGKGVLFTLSAATPAASRIAVASLETGAVTELLSGGSYPRYVPTGHIVYGVDGTLRAVGFDQDRLTITGSPVPVVEGVLTKPLGAAVFAVASSGSLVYLEAASGSGARRELIWVERDGSEKHVGFADGAPTWPRLSPDGTRAAFLSASDVWVVDLARGTPSRVTNTGGVAFVLWHPDGRRVLFSSAREGKTAPVPAVRRRHRHSRAAALRDLRVPSLRKAGRLTVASS